MTYVMIKPYPICKRGLTKQEPTDSVNYTCGNMIGGSRTLPGNKNVGRSRYPSRRGQ